MIDRIVEVLEKATNYLTIKEICHELGLKKKEDGKYNKQKLDYIRLCVYRLEKVYNKIVNQGRRKKEHLYSLTKDVITENNPLHTTILKKMIPPFAKQGIKVILEDIEQKEIQKLWGESNE
ncbi:hypothetical protein LCGC14_2863390 [marine sediment metagenome]|uniref:Uncharacterized protein n=1 Tax=marine sediment metagenome TaxID=412755 RepID=A0A0F8Y4Y2_9ZZZZ